YAGYWEFPGGKLEAGESPHAALVRELREELGVVVHRAAPWLVQEFVYPHAHVELHFFRVFEWSGELFGHDGQAFAWQTPGAWDVAPLLPANTRILSALALPDTYAISNAAQIGEDALVARAHAAFAAGLRLLQLRDRELPVERRMGLAARLVPLARGSGANLMWNGTADEARASGCAGVHWTAARLMAASTRPQDLLVGASCHNAAELAHAGALGLDCAVLGPVARTPSHPGAPVLGWNGFSAMAANTRLPVYALGGLGRDDLATAITHGAQGVALMRGAWSA
ncbi:MAG: Nudix family hydrolase, partial [Burkholderiaceae bacterium]